MYQTRCTMQFTDRTIAWYTMRTAFLYNALYARRDWDPDTSLLCSVRLTLKRTQVQLLMPTCYNEKVCINHTVSTKTA